MLLFLYPRCLSKLPQSCPKQKVMTALYSEEPVCAAAPSPSSAILTVLPCPFFLPGYPLSPV